MKTPGNDVSEISIRHPVNEHSYANEPKAPLLLPNKMEYRPETNLNHHWKILVNNNFKKKKTETLSMSREISTSRSVNEPKHANELIILFLGIKIAW